MINSLYVINPRSIASRQLNVKHAAIEHRVAFHFESIHDTTIIESSRIALRQIASRRTPESSKTSGRQKLGKNCAANIRNLAATAGQSPVKEVCERIAAFSTLARALRRASRLHFRVDVDATRRVASRRAAPRLVPSHLVASLANLDANGTG